jgi:phosphatidylserine/phosphatidylglycerophosphate/cardiolipin synthase-like enzyme
MDRRSRSTFFIFGLLLACCLLAVVGYVVLRPQRAAVPQAAAPAAVAPAANQTPTPIIASAAATPAAAATATALASAALASAAQTTATQPAATAATWYQLYFTRPQYPDNSANHHGSLDEPLTAFINTAQKSVDIAIYQFDLPNVTQALLDAAKRGALVRVVTDIDILNDPKENPSFKKLQAAKIKVVGGNPNAIMHDKFVVVDGAAVWTGSWNFTTNDTYRYNNNGILIHSPELAHNYTVTFEKMWRDKKFGAGRKPGGTTPQLTIDSVPVGNYFAPEDKVAEKIVARLQTAQRSIDFLAFSFTDDAIGSTVRARAQAGVQVRGVFETTGSETKYSEYGRMKAAGLDVLQDGNPYLMHHKVFIIDGQTVIFGSFNFSQNAETANDENLLIIDDPALAAQFTAEFARVYATAQHPPNKQGNEPTPDPNNE